MRLSKSNVVGSGVELSKEMHYFEMQHCLTHLGAFIANAVLPLYSLAFCVLGVASNSISGESQYKPI